MTWADLFVAVACGAWILGVVAYLADIRAQRAMEEDERQ